MRRARAPKRPVSPDPKFNNVVVGRLINFVMERGKKSTAQRIIYDAFDIMEKKAKKPPMEVFDAALRATGPSVELKSRRIGGANYQIPVEVKEDRRLVLSLRWILSAARARKGMPMARRLADEFLEASLGQGTAVKKKEDTHRMAEANKAFAHFA